MGPQENKSLPKFSALILLINIIALLSVVVILAITLNNRPMMQNAFWSLSYYIIFALIGTWVWALYRLWQERKPDPRLFLKAHVRGIIVSLALASLVFVSVPKYFRVLSDDTNLLSVAKSMTFYKHTQLIVEGRRYYEIYWPMVPGVTEKRPFLFPSFVSLFHTFLGYRIENVFIMNFFVLWASLFLLYLIIRKYLDEIWAYASLILVTAQPVISLSAASGSFEMFNFMFILISFLSLRHFLDKPDHPSFLVLTLTLVMLMNSRYESVLVLGTVMAVILGFNYVRIKFFKESTAYALVPFFFLPWIWQRILYIKIHDDLPGGTWVKAFEFHNITANLPPFLRYAFDWTGSKGFAGIIDFMGVLAACYFVGMFFISYRKRPIDKKYVALIVSGIVSCFLLVGVVLLYADGLVTKHPMNGRFFIPSLAALTVLVVCFFANVIKNRSMLAKPVLFGAIAFFIYYHPVAVEDSLTNNLIIIREHRFVEDFLKHDADHRALFIIGRPGQLIVYNYGAIAFATANREIQDIQQQWKNHLYSNIFVVQEISYSNLQPNPGFWLNPSLHLETVRELQTNADHFLRISKVVGIDNTAR